MTRAHSPTLEARRVLERGASFGLPHEALAAMVGVNPGTLRRHYRDELDLGTARMIGNVATALYETALNPQHPGHVTACIFILKTRGRWSTRAAPEAEPIDDPDPDV